MDRLFNSYKGLFFWVLFSSISLGQLINESDTLLDLSKFNIEGHRGDYGNVPPGNTLPSFQSALDYGKVTTLEGDMRITNDGKVVFGHDNGILNNCTWTGNGAAPTRNFSALNLSQIALFDCHSSISGIQAPPSPEQLFELALAEDPQIKFDLEFKDMTNADVDIAMGEIIAYNNTCNKCLDGKITFQSFNWANQSYIKTNYYDKAASGNFKFKVAILGGATSNYQSALSYADVFSPSHGGVTQAIVNQVHGAGLEVLPWTVDDPTRMVELILLGVDGIITNYPNRLIAVVDSLTPVTTVSKPKLKILGTGVSLVQNKFNGLLSIKFIQSDLTKNLFIYSLTGVLIKQINTVKNKIIIDSADMMEGIYLIKVQIGKKSSVMPFTFTNF